MLKSEPGRRPATAACQLASGLRATSSSERLGHVQAYSLLLRRNLNYWDSVSTLAGEVQDPGRAFPRALAGAVGLVVAGYLVPLVVGLSFSAAAADWNLGYFAVVGGKVGGPVLAWAVVLAAVVSQVGQFEAEMSTDSYLLHGMAERGFLPALFARKSRHGTPSAGIVASAIGILAMARWVGG